MILDALNCKRCALTNLRSQHLAPVDASPKAVCVVYLNNVSLNEDLLFFPIEPRDLKRNQFLLFRCGTNYQGVAAAFYENRLLASCFKSARRQG